MKLTAERLRQLLRYDPETGIFTSIAARKKVVVGTRAGTRDASTGYRKLCIDRHLYYEHRVAFLCMTGEWPKERVDHINGTRDDNRWANLRDVSHQTNMQNQRKAPRNSPSGLLGAHRKRNKWASHIQVGGRLLKLGSFATPEAAHEAYVAAKRIHHEGCTL